MSEELHPETSKLVDRFAVALKEKLLESQHKYGWTDDWAKDDWQARCSLALCRHLAKGDPRDVAAFAAFMWHHDWPTSWHLPGGEVATRTAQANTPAAEVVGEIVSFIRQQADIGASFGNAAEKGSTRRAAFGGGSLALDRLADEIERGAYHSAKCIGCGDYIGHLDYSVDDNGETGCEACFTEDGQGRCFKNPCQTLSHSEPKADELLRALEGSAPTPCAEGGSHCCCQCETCCDCEQDVMLKPDWLNAETCLTNIAIALMNDSTFSEDGPVDTVVSSGDLQCLFSIANAAAYARHAHLKGADHEG